MTGREFVSQVRSLNKIFSDGTINDRTIMREGRNAVNLLVHQDMDKRKLWQSPNLFAYLPCLEMEQVSIGECCEFTGECNIAKSIKKLPKIGEGIWGLAIQGVFGLDGKKKMKEIDPNRYANYLKLGLKVKDVFYWIRDDHIYCTNPDTQLLDIYLYPTEDVPNDLLFPGEDCPCKNKPDIATLCTPALDKKFYLPDYRMKDVIDIVEKNLLSTYYRIPLDRTSNNNDEQTP